MTAESGVVLATLARRVDRLGRWSLLAAASASTVLAVARLLDLRWLGAPVDDSAPIMLNGAVGLAAFSWTTIAMRRWRESSAVRRATRVVGAGIALLGIATLFEHATGVALGIDELLRRDTWSAHTAPGRPAPQAAFAIATFGLTLAVPDRWVRWRDSLIVAATVAGLLGLGGHLLGVEELVVLGGTYGLPLETGVLIVLAGAGFGLTAPRSATSLAPIVSDTPGGALVRRLILLVLLVPLGAGALDSLLAATGVAGEQGTGWIITTVGVSITLVLGWRVAMTVDDLTGRISVERARLETLISSLPDDVRRFDTFGHEEVLNPMEGRRLDIAAREHIVRVAAQALDGQPAREGITLDRAGAVTHLDVIATPIETAEGVAGAITVTRDVTELHATQQRYRELFDSIPEGIYELHHDGAIVVVNDPLAHMLGFADATDLLTTVSHAQPLWVDTQERDEILRGIRAGVTSGIIDARLRRRDGEIITVELSYRVVMSPSGTPTGLRGTVRDVTKERIASAQLAEVQDRYRLAFENGPLGRLVLDMAAGSPRFLQVNQPLASMLGYQVEEMCSLDPLELVHPDDRAREADALERCICGDAQTIAYDTRRRHRSGEWIPVGLTGALLRDESGRPRYAVASVEDLRPRLQATDALMAATALAERRARQSAALNELSAAVLSTVGVDRLYALASRLLVLLLGVEIVVVYEQGPDTGWRLAGHLGLDPDWVALPSIHVPDDSDVADVARTLTTRMVADWRAEQDLRPVPLLRAHGVRSAVSTVVDGARTAVLSVASTALRTYDHEEVALLESVARLLGVARVNEETRRELARSQQTLAALVDNAPAAVYLFDTEGRFIVANREMARILGVSNGDVVGRTRRDVPAYDAETAAQHEAHDAEVIDAGSPQTYEESAPGSDDARTYLSVKFPLLDEHGAPFGVGGISTDITPIKDLESENRRAWNEMLRRIARAVEYRDEETGAHIDRMSAYCGLLADQLGLGSERAASIQAAAALHDAGKIAIPDAILLKPGALTAQEREVVQQHCEVGYHLLRGTGTEVLELAATIAWTHHERWDGSGYPRGLRGEEIPLEARIAAVADVFDALTSDRVYRPAVSVDGALAMLRDGAGQSFDPTVVAALVARTDDALAILRRYAEEPAGGPRPGLQARYGSAPERVSTG